MNFEMLEKRYLYQLQVEKKESRFSKWYHLPYMPTAFVPGGPCRDNRSMRDKGTSPRAWLVSQAPVLS